MYGLRNAHQMLWKYLDRMQKYTLKRNSKRFLRRQNSTSGSNFDNCHLSGTFLRIILQKNFLKIAQRAAELYAIQLFLYLHLNQHC